MLGSRENIGPLSFLQETCCVPSVQSRPRTVILEGSKLKSFTKMSAQEAKVELDSVLKSSIKLIWDEWENNT